ncbi:hypothetical protein GURASL_30220 [Geotalea uraniireducens]|uniref:Uncharacterized protein n=1 Tax=Geotalea uraniireducens TaxID=351604 RepID=A0ABN6VXD3_9BACT|nr:hypothetical protein [Geotalea uraniireducens]BDV44099.1 hypothetical protein GURASL_30220 [Geotalea uraniireducens]
MDEQIPQRQVLSTEVLAVHSLFEAIQELTGNNGSSLPTCISGLASIGQEKTGLIMDILSGGGN